MKIEKTTIKPFVYNTYETVEDAGKFEAVVETKENCSFNSASLYLVLGTNSIAFYHVLFI